MLTVDCRLDTSGWVGTFQMGSSRRGFLVSKWPAWSIDSSLMASVIGYFLWQITWSPRKPKITTLPTSTQGHKGRGQGPEDTSVIFPPSACTTLIEFLLLCVPDELELSRQHTIPTRLEGIYWD